MDNVFLLIDFGSTYTKVLAVDVEKEEILGRAQSASTVNDNMLKGLRNALKLITVRGKPIDEEILKKSVKLACSSAAGGLRLVAIGLVPELTLEAARRAALGAGAKVVGSYSYELNEDDLKKIEAAGCDIILLSGGTDGGNKEVILHNANMLSNSTLNVPFVIAGNRVVSGEIKKVLDSRDKYAEKTENVLPDLDKLNVEPARSCIREIFMKRIIQAKGLDKAQEFIGDILMPTPMATLKAAQLLADGYGHEPGLGELMVVEVGGATTNIHSIAEGYKPGRPVIQKGLPEPYAKRTVEGDLGIRYNAQTIVEMLGAEKVLNEMPRSIEKTNLDLREYTSFLNEHTSYVPENERDFMVDLGLARSAVEVAVERHVGTIKEEWSPHDTVKIQYGKDLTDLKTLIGTGGIFAYNPQPQKVLEAALYTVNNPFSLKPQAPEFYIDHNYILYGIGLLSSVEPEAALKIARKYLSKTAASSNRNSFTP